MTEPTVGFSDERRAQVREVLFRLLQDNGTPVSDNTETIRYEIKGEYGAIVVFFQINPGFFDWALRTSLALSDRAFTSATDTLFKEGKIERVSEVDQPEPVLEVDAEQSLMQENEIAGFLAYLAVQGIPGKFKSAVFELGLETGKIFEAFIQKALKETDLIKATGYEPPNMVNEIKALTKRLASERKQFLINQIDSFSDKPRLERLPELYPTLLKVWQSAKKIHADNAESETWRAMVKAKYPELQFDDDLLTRVTGKLEDLSEEIQAKLNETDGDHTPSTIALEHAARMCGAQPYQHGTRHYHNLKTAKTEQPESK